jgi:cytochrome bd-type quinol oxidase subunit 1
MQHPVAYERTSEGFVQLTSFWDLLLNPWLGWQYTHTMTAAVVTASFLMSAVGAYYLLARTHEVFGRVFLRIGLVAGFISAVLVAFPSGDAQIKNVYEHQPITFAAMEGVFETKEGVELVLIGQPDMEQLRIDNPLHENPNFVSSLPSFSLRRILAFRLWVQASPSSASRSLRMRRERTLRSVRHHRRILPLLLSCRTRLFLLPSRPG